MKINWIGIAGIVLLAVAAVFGYVLDVPSGDIVAVASAFFGAGLILADKIGSRGELALWKAAVCYGASAAGGLLIALAGLAESTVATVVLAVFGAAALIGGLIAAKKLE